MITYRDRIAHDLHFALVRGTPDASTPTLVRVQVENPLADLLHWRREDFGVASTDALRLIAEAGEGVLVVLSMPRDGEALLERLRAGPGTTSAAGKGKDAGQWRRNGAGAQILSDLGLGQLRVIGTPRKQVGLAGIRAAGGRVRPRLRIGPVRARRCLTRTRSSAARGKLADPTGIDRPHEPLRRRPARPRRCAIRHPRQPLEPEDHRCAGCGRAQGVHRPWRGRGCGGPGPGPRRLGAAGGRGPVGGGRGTPGHRRAGLRGARQEAGMFVENAKAAPDPQRRISALNARYAGGDRSPEFLRKYTDARAQMMDGSHGKIAEEYLQTQKDWGTEENMEFLMQSAEDPDSPMFAYLFKERVKFEEAFGEEMVQGKIQQAAFGKVMKMGDLEPEAAVKKMDAFFTAKCPDIAPRLSVQTAMTVYKMTGNADLYAKNAVQYYDQFPSDNFLELNEAAWGFYETVEDKAMLQKALGWGLKSIALQNEYFNNDTVAALYYKIGNKKQAMKYAKKAIAIAKKNGEDASETEALLAKMKGKGK